MRFSVHQPPSGRSIPWLLAALLVAVLAGASLGGWAPLGSPVLAKASPAVVPELAPAVRGPVQVEFPESWSFAPVVKKVAPAVVSIATTRVAPVAERGGFPFFFGPGGPQPEGRQQGLGSGVIVTPEGYILTNHHVVDEAHEIKVHLSDDREFPATIVGSDPRTDIAVLKVEAGGLPLLPLGNSSQVEVGDVVLAVGNPFGLGQTVTMGIVGATGRGGLGIEDYEDFIQTDAAINPGNSGGALVNGRGELIGINTAILSRSGGNQGVGFAVPINLAHHVMTQILEHGRVTRGYLGVGIQNVSPAMAKAFKAPDAKGALVGNVEPGGPADKAGLKRGDIIRELDGQPVDDARQLRLQIAQTPPGSEVKLGVWNDGRERNVAMKLGEFPDEPQAAAKQAGASEALAGLQVGELTPAVARQLDLPNGTQGVVVMDVQPGSAPAEAGLRRGDVIQEVARQPVTNVAEFRAAVGREGKGPILLLVNRGGNTQFVVLEPR